MRYWRHHCSKSPRHKDQSGEHYLFPHNSVLGHKIRTLLRRLRPCDYCIVRKGMPSDTMNQWGSTHQPSTNHLHLQVEVRPDRWEQRYMILQCNRSLDRIAREVLSSLARHNTDPLGKTSSLHFYAAQCYCCMFPAWYEPRDEVRDYDALCCIIHVCLLLTLTRMALALLHQ